MRNISFSITTDQFRNRTKYVTRRLGWKFLEADELLMGVEKAMGLKSGEHVKQLGAIRVLAVSFEPLNRLWDESYAKEETSLEGFPGMTGNDFTDMFCRHNNCLADTQVTRIQFMYVEDTDEYPHDWKEIAFRKKQEAGWMCERCGCPHKVEGWKILTVHHLDGVKANCAPWNLAALCQRCHLHIQAKVKMDQMFFTEILDVSPWFKPHLIGYMKSIEPNIQPA